MLMYILIEYNDNHLKTSRILWQYYRDVPVLAINGDITDFTETDATTESFNIKEKLTVQIEDNGTKNVEVIVPLIVKLLLI